MYEDHTDAFLLAGLGCIILIAAVLMAIPPSENKFMELGDEVATTDEYNSLFNDSFSGRVVAKDDGMHTVRDENGTERAFEWTWLEKVDAEEVKSDDN